MTRVSIITVCKNSEKTIEQTIQSVLAQNHPGIEYIIVDGVSTDRTCEIIKRYENHLSRYISEPDNGLYDAMNKGIGLATGDITAFINSDDWYDENAISGVVEEWERACPDVLYGDYTVVDNGIHDKRTYEDRSAIQLREWQWIPHPSTFCKTDLYKELLFDTRYKIAADYAFFLELLNRKKSFVYLNRNLSFFRADGLSGTRYPECMYEIRQIATDAGKRYGYWNSAFEESLRIRYYSSLEGFCRKRMEDCALLHESVAGYAEKQFVVFGAGRYAKDCIADLREEGLSPLFVVDNNRKKWGSVFEGCRVEPPEALRKMDDIRIIVTTRTIGHIKEVFSQLEDMSPSASVEVVRYDEMLIPGIERCLRPQYPRLFEE